MSNIGKKPSLSDRFGGISSNSSFNGQNSAYVSAQKKENYSNDFKKYNRPYNSGQKNSNLTVHLKINRQKKENNYNNYVNRPSQPLRIECRDRPSEIAKNFPRQNDTGGSCNWNDRNNVQNQGRQICVKDNFINGSSTTVNNYSPRNDTNLRKSPVPNRYGTSPRSGNSPRTCDGLTAPQTDFNRKSPLGISNTNSDPRTRPLYNSTGGWNNQNGSHYTNSLYNGQNSTTNSTCQNSARGNMHIQPNGQRSPGFSAYVPHNNSSEQLNNYQHNNFNRNNNQQSNMAPNSNQYAHINQYANCGQNLAPNGNSEVQSFSNRSSHPLAGMYNCNAENMAPQSQKIQYGENNNIVTTPEEPYSPGTVFSPSELKIISRVHTSPTFSSDNSNMSLDSSNQSDPNIVVNTPEVKIQDKAYVDLSSENFKEVEALTKMFFEDCENLKRTADNEVALETVESVKSLFESEVVPALNQSKGLTKLLNEQANQGSQHNEPGEDGEDLSEDKFEGRTLLKGGVTPRHIPKMMITTHHLGPPTDRRQIPNTARCELNIPLPKWAAGVLGKKATENDGQNLENKAKKSDDENKNKSMKRPVDNKAVDKRQTDKKKLKTGNGHQKSGKFDSSKENVDQKDKSFMKNNSTNHSSNERDLSKDRSRTCRPRSRESSRSRNRSRSRDRQSWKNKQGNQNRSSYQNDYRSRSREVHNRSPVKYKDDRQKKSKNVGNIMASIMNMHTSNRPSNNFSSINNDLYDSDRAGLRFTK